MQINVLLAFIIVASFLFATALHEWAHAQMAALLNDPTPTKEGRKTLNFRAHIDPVGLLMCVILAFQPLAPGTGIEKIRGYPPSGLGWGKPVKPDPWKMRVNANTGVLLVACAGPVFSLLLGLIVGAFAQFLMPLVMTGNFFAVHFVQIFVVFACVNVSLALFNLIPLPPLDGYQILYTLLPSPQALQFSRIAPYGPFIILAIFFLLPFLGNLAGLGDFPLFRLAYYIWLGAAWLVSLVMNTSFEIVSIIYFA